MGLPPPRLRDLNAWIQEGNSRTKTSPREMWETGVPAKNSLPWSIVLSVLFLDSDEDFPSLLRKLTGEELEIKEIKEKKRLSGGKINPEEIRKILKSFNPFKNRHSFLHSTKISEIVRIFDLRLKRYAKDINTGMNVWNDDLKLRAASRLLKCGIDVYFPDETETRKTISYAGTSKKCKAKIILFQYENQEHGSRADTINIFYFGMSLKHAHGLKLDALEHFLKKAKISSIGEIKRLMNNPEAHGKAFLPTIIDSNCLDILPEIYRSPYIAFKLSEAGFETDPIAESTEKPSALCYALCNRNPIYLRILYDYACNCRSLFNRSVRRADQEVLENLKRIKSIIQSDIIKVQTIFEKSSLERALHVLKQLKKFVEYQIKIASDLWDLKNKPRSNSKSAEFQFRKSIVETILEHYLTFFYYESEKSGNISLQFADYLTFAEYYEYTDNFSFLSFFDNFFKLRSCCGLKEEDMILNIEWKIFLAMMSNIYFPILVSKSEFEDLSGTVKSGKSILRYIQLFYRKTLESEVKLFLNKLKGTSTYDSLKEEILPKDSNSLPQVIDELLIIRLNKYIEAVLEVSPETDGMKAVLVIERALQVLGESIKPPSSKGSIVSFLLRSCLSPSLQFEIIRTRNDLSKYRCNSVFGRTKVEKDCNIFEGIKKEFKRIQEAFEIITFTQYLRIKENVVHMGLNGLKKDLDSDTYEELEHEYYKDQRNKNYDKYHRRCIKLLLDSFSDLQENSHKMFSNKIQKNEQHIFGQLKSVEYLIMFIKRYKREIYLDNLLSNIKHFTKAHVDDKDKDKGQPIIPITKENMDSFLLDCSKEILKNNPGENEILSAPIIETFFSSLKEAMFLSEEKQKIYEAVESALKEASDAKNKLENIFHKALYESEENIDELLKIILIPFDKLSKIRKCFEERDGKLAGKYLKKCIPEDSVKKDVEQMLETESMNSGYACTLLTKVAFQSQENSKFFTSVTLPNEICKKLKYFLTKKANFLITRLKALKNILIEEEEEIRLTNKWGRSEPIKYHLKFLMRQRYKREKTIYASLEMAYFDCMNIFSESPTKNDELSSEDPLRELYEKSTDLFAGINLRNTVSHRQNIPETIGGILDEDDFPSEMIEKICQLIDDTEAVEEMLKLFQVSGVLEENDFLDGVENNRFEKYSGNVKTIKECTRWKEYLFLFPFIKT